MIFETREIYKQQSFPTQSASRILLSFSLEFNHPFISNNDAFSFRNRLNVNKKTTKLSTCNPQI